jgi:hypothetical protein
MRNTRFSTTVGVGSGVAVGADGLASGTSVTSLQPANKMSASKAIRDGIKRFMASLQYIG